MDSELYFKINDYFKKNLSQNIKNNESLFYFLFKEEKQEVYYELNTVKDDELNCFIIKFRNEPVGDFLAVGYLSIDLKDFQQVGNGSELSLDFNSTPVTSFVSLFKSLGGLQNSYDKSKIVLEVIKHFFEKNFTKFINASDENNSYNVFYKCFIYKDKERKHDRNIILFSGENCLKGRYEHMTPLNMLQFKGIIFELNKKLIQVNYSTLDKKILQKEINDSILNNMVQYEIVYFLTNELYDNIDSLASFSYNINNILQEDEKS